MSNQILTPEDVKMENCQREIAGILNRYGFQFEPWFAVNGGQMTQGIRIVPKKALTPEEEQAMRDAMGGGLQNGG